MSKTARKDTGTCLSPSTSTRPHPLQAKCPGQAIAGRSGDRNGAPALRDAGGRTPKPLTKFERKWRESSGSGTTQRRFDALRNRQKLPLEKKIALSLQRIWEWIEAFDGNVAVSYSGGVDSEVLLHLVRRIRPTIPAVFINTGLEYPEIRRQVTRTENCVTYRPKKPFHQVIRDHGWPMISKKTARGISILRNPTPRNQNISRLYREGINRFGEAVNGFKVANRWRSS